MKKAFEMEKKDFDNIIRKNLVAQVGDGPMSRFSTS